MIRPFISAHSAALVVWILTLLAWVIPERAQNTRRRRAGATVGDRGSQAVFAACLVPGFIVLALSRKIAPGALIKPPVAAFVVGEIVFIMGAAVRLWAVRTLGEYFTTTVQTSDDQAVISSGPYRFVLHPSYTGLLLIAVGAGLVVGNWIGLAVVVVLMLVALVYRIRVEEDALTSALGDSYRTYASEHRRLIPGIW